MVHPNHHPTLVKFYTYVVHFHPRLCKMGGFGLLALAILAQALTLVGPYYLKYMVRKKGPLTETNLKSSQYLDRALPVTVPLVLTQAWQALNDALPGMVVQGADMRRASWIVVARDEGRRQLQLELRYVHNPLGIKYWRLYPRRLTCSVKLRAKGISTIVDLKYHADSAMDYRLISEIIDITNAAVSRMTLSYETPVPATILSQSMDAASLVPAG